MNNQIDSGGFYKGTIQDGIMQGAPDSELKQQHPELFGRLLMANEKLENVGTMVIWLLILAVVGVCVTIHMAWVDPLLGIPIEKLQGWGVYTLITIAAFVLYSVYNEIFERMAYQNVKTGIMDYMAKHQLTVPWLVAQLENEEGLSEVAEHLKKEPVSQNQMGR